MDLFLQHPALLQQRFGFGQISKLAREAAGIPQRRRRAVDVILFAEETATRHVVFVGGCVVALRLCQIPQIVQRHCPPKIVTEISVDGGGARQIIHRWCVLAQRFVDDPQEVEGEGNAVQIPRRLIQRQALLCQRHSERHVTAMVGAHGPIPQNRGTAHRIVHMMQVGQRFIQRLIGFF